MTTLSALHKHITHAISATTLNLSGITKLLSCPFTKNPLSIPSAAHFTTHALCFFTFNPSVFLPPPPTICFLSTFALNPNRVVLNPIELKWVSEKHEEILLEEAGRDLEGANEAMGKETEIN
jgi:hypothetical protein